ncbi:hypothetical protein ISF_07876 [Cordyceps fumosorosea ARSEF 2679]|uniref:Heat-labile enterotoxin, A chain n=1 Tax=Cordyceps fumosorosea (strain ARSEF 2679) TaxID=1081104 RepID=A0A162ICW7_CORFA|nr:hypothetical protein ISF_07876 [Cordyceps fumosorosea ARSEF 2679]OAA55365.1 hypothetical protein ISF_07876 [Cordyceps fumosorosea ARSEF 2679]
MIFHHLLALLGLATFGAAYSLPGAYERLLLYYTYRMDLMTHGTTEIATGCPGSGGKPCTLEEFITYINHGDLVLEDEATGTGKKPTKKPTKGKLDLGLNLKEGELPPVKKTAQILMEKKINGQIDPQKVVKGTKGDYPALFKKIGDFISSKWTANPVNAGDAAKFLEIKQGAFDSMVAVRNARMEAAVDSWKPAEGFEVIKIFDDLGGASVNIKEMASKSGKKKTELVELFKKHIEGAHQENIKYLKDSVALVCGKGGTVSPGRKRELSCGSNIFGEKWGGDIEGVSKPSGLGEVSKLGKAAEMAEAVSEKEFGELASKRGLKALAKEKWSMSLSEVRTKINYKALTPETPKLGIKGGTVLNGAAMIVGVGFWINDVVNAFTHNVTALDRAATVASIAPFVGCAVKTAADLDKQSLDIVDTSLCLVADSLLFTPAFPVAVVLHLVRSIMSWYKPPEQPTLDEFRSLRDGAWNKYLKNEVYAYIYSHPNYYEFKHKARPADKTFLEKMESAFAIEELAVLSQGAQTIGAATGSAQEDLEAAASPEDKAKIQEGVDAAAEQLRQAARNETIRRHRQALLSMPKSLQESQEDSLLKTSDKFNEKFTDDLVSEEMVSKYTTNYNGDASLAFGENSNKKDITKMLEGFRDTLWGEPPELPSYFTLAYILGQSRAVAPLDKETLSISAYLREKFPEMSPSQIQELGLHHTFEMGLLLNGTKTESQLSTYFPTQDEAARKELQTLVALKFGRVYDDWKMEQMGRQLPAGLILDTPEFKGLKMELIHPQIPPYNGAASAGYAALVAGMTTALAESLKENAEALGKSAGARSIMDQSAKLEGLMPGEKQAAAKLRRALPRSSKEYRAQLVRAY